MALVVSSCGDPDSFRVEGTVANNRTMNIRMVYAGDDVLNNVLTAARDGQFRFKGSAPKGSLLRVLDNDYRVLAYLYVENGDFIKLTIDPDNADALSVKGNEVSERWAEWLAGNRAMIDTGNTQKINGIVRQYVKAHPSDLLSTLLMVTLYDAGEDPVEARKLLESIDREARPTQLIGSWIEVVGRIGSAESHGKVRDIRYMDNRDSIKTFSPRNQKYALLAFSDEESGRRDSVIQEIRQIKRRFPDSKRFRLLDVSMEADTFAWRRINRTDSVKWQNAWVAGSISAPGVENLGIPRLPYFIITDSAGTQVWRGHEVSLLQTKLDSLGIR